MKLTVSIVLYKTSKEELVRTISFFEDTKIKYHLFLVDNSPDNNLRSVVKNNNLTYIFNGKNLGYGKGHNIAIKKIINDSAFHLILNSDVTFSPPDLSKLITYMKQHPEIGLVMPKVLSNDDKIQHLCKLLPTPLDLLLRMLLPLKINNFLNKKFDLIFADYNKTMEVPFLSGCFMLLRVDALKEIGLFDERFFLYAEDIDLSRRVHEKYKTIYYPEVEIIHKHAKGSFKNFKLMLTHILSIIKYFNKWGWINDPKRRKINKQVLKQLNYKKYNEK